MEGAILLKYRELESFLSKTIIKQRPGGREGAMRESGEVNPRLTARRPL